MDTDGSLVEPKCGGVEFSVMDELLANDTWELIKSLGYKATYRKDRAILNGIDMGIRYRIYFTPHRAVFRHKADEVGCFFSFTKRDQSCS